MTHAELTGKISGVGVADGTGHAKPADGQDGGHATRVTAAAHRSRAAIREINARGWLGATSE